jgi:deazaflavin-dependent oxidoreductase (nitroreductase family)
MPGSQKNEPFDEPSREDIPKWSRMHVAAMETMDDDAVWIGAGMHQLVLRTVGRKSGNEHKVALPYWFDADGHRIVVGSFAGAEKDPAWCLNLADSAANPKVQVRVQHQPPFWADAIVLSGDDREMVWAGLTADRPYYNDYQSRTTRQIPLIRLVQGDPI